MTASQNTTELWITVGVFLTGAGGVGVMSWLERRPRKSLTPRLIPTTPVLMAFGFLGLLALVHLVNLFGVITGRQ
ncbi:hypothetical protein [Aestuariivirga sp.]|jgi:hypothetical protein|uniref:hypothetical protein n=1 Tax=Aestuariivirga sp. TaxID=2650926 RepID=UPI003784DFA5